MSYKTAKCPSWEEAPCTYWWRPRSGPALIHSLLLGVQESSDVVPILQIRKRRLGRLVTGPRLHGNEMAAPGFPGGASPDCTAKPTMLWNS